MVSDPHFWLSLTQIIWIDIVLSGDNALVIALACRHLPSRYRRWGVILGTVCAVVLRLVFAGGIVYLLQVPYLKLVGSLLLFWIACKLVLPETTSQEKEPEKEELSGYSALNLAALWLVVRTIIIADAVMSLDNVISVAAAAKGSFLLLALGIAISIPLMVAGSSLMLWVLDRFPILLVAGAGLLGWIAGQLALHDPVLSSVFMPNFVFWLIPALGAGVVIGYGYLKNKPIFMGSRGKNT